MVVLGATPAGISAAIAAARGGRSVLVLERSRHVGGLPANGLGATDVSTRRVTGGLFAEFIARVRRTYVRRYGETSPQVRDSGDGYRFEPSVAEAVFEEMLAEWPHLRVLRERQFEPARGDVELEGTRLVALTVTDLVSGRHERYRARVFVDATYEGDLAAAAGVPFRLGREARSEFHERLAGRLYKFWEGPIAEGSTGEGDGRVQAYDYRLCLTRDPSNRVALQRPARYDRLEYQSLLADIRNHRSTRMPTPDPAAPETIDRLVQLVALPNRKFDANNQHLSFVSTDLPEENQSWPEGSWAIRDAFAVRLHDYTLGLLWFCQHDPEIPPQMQSSCSQWGLARDEYTDNDHFPRAVYVREARRIVGEATFTEHDALPGDGAVRPALHAASITAADYALDSHGVRKREPGRAHLDGFFNVATQPFTVPYGVIVPQKVDALLVPVAVSSSHVGFSALRLEPEWMALGQAAGVAASMAVATTVAPRALAVERIQEELLSQRATLFYIEDVSVSDADFARAQKLGLAGLLPGWRANLDAPLDTEARSWPRRLHRLFPSGVRTRRELLRALFP